MRDTPLVNVIIVTYNGEMFIEKCLKSLLKQTYLKERYFVTVVDNASKDNTLSNIGSFPVVKLIKNSKNLGFSAANNVALEFDLADFLGVYGMKRATMVSKLQFNLELARKYKMPLILASGAQNVYGLRNATQIIAFAESLGFKHEEAKAAVLKTPFELVKRNREKRKGIEIEDGVKIVKE